MNKALFLPLIILFFLFYYFMFPLAGSQEVYWTASELYDFRTLDHSPDSLKVPILVNQGQHQGVLFPEGGKAYLLNAEDQAALSETQILLKSVDSLILKNLTDQSVKRISSHGSPLVLSGHYYSADFSSALLEEFDASGNSLWRWRGTSPITAIDVGNSCTVFGSVDGRVRFFTSQGEMTEFIPGFGKTDNVVYGIALSEDCSKLAVLSGLDKQFIRQYELRENSAPELFHEEQLSSRYPRPVKLYYSASGSLLWVEQDQSLYQYRRGGERSILALDGTLLTQRSDESSGLVYILSRLNPSSFSDKSYEIAVYTMTGSLIMRNRFDEYPEFFYMSERDIYLSMDDNFLILKRVES